MHKNSPPSCRSQVSVFTTYIPLRQPLVYMQYILAVSFLSPQCLTCMHVWKHVCIYACACMMQDGSACLCHLAWANQLFWHALYDSVLYKLMRETLPADQQDILLTLVHSGRKRCWYIANAKWQRHPFALLETVIKSHGSSGLQSVIPSIGPQRENDRGPRRSALSVSALDLEP